MKISPFVSVVTPVFNGEKHLAECMQSVLYQEYDNWEYIIVNNCSIDSTAEIADYYSNMDKRIRVHNNRKFLGIIENHNQAFRLISSESKYCKVVSSDDVLRPSCLKKLVDLAERHPTVGIVGSYQVSGCEIKWRGIPQELEVISGAEVCRKTLLEKFLVFGPPTSVLYRAGDVREKHDFFPHSLPHADSSVFYNVLQKHDLGFVHEVLSEGRIHEGQMSNTVKRLHKGNAAYLDIFLSYGRCFLTDSEFDNRKKEIIRNYHNWLGGCALKLYGLEFWKFHVNRLGELGCPVSWSGVIAGIFREIAAESVKPVEALHKVIRVFMFGEKLE